VRETQALRIDELPVDKRQRGRSATTGKLRIGDIIRYRDESGRNHLGALASVHRGRGVLMLRTNDQLRSIPIRDCYSQLVSDKLLLRPD
jgi:hypothetical protein